MKTRPFFSALLTFAIGFALVSCSKKSEPIPAAPTPAPAPAQTSATDTAKALADAAEAKLVAAKKEAEAIQAKAEAEAKARAAELQALADQKSAEVKLAADKLKQQTTDASNALLAKANAFKSDATTATQNASSATSVSASATPSSASNTSLQSLAQNLTPANFSAWYDKASAESSGIISSLATKAADLGSQASPQFKSFYETVLSQKKTFDEVSAQIKSGGLTQWAVLYPKLQTSWTDLSKSLTDAKALLAQYSK